MLIERVFDIGSRGRRAGVSQPHARGLGDLVPYARTYNCLGKFRCIVGKASLSFRPPFDFCQGRVVWIESAKISRSRDVAPYCKIRYIIRKLLSRSWT